MAINIVTYMNAQEPVKSWPPAKKQLLLDRFCKARGYEETITNGNDETIANPQTKKEFMNLDILNYIQIMFRADAEREAKEALVIEKIIFS